MSPTFRAIFWAGLACGVLDLIAAIVTWAPKGVRPPRLLQGIASGLLGAKAFGGGWRTAALGAACHFFIAFSAAAVFYALSRKLSFFLVPSIGLSAFTVGQTIALCGLPSRFVCGLPHCVQSWRTRFGAGLAG